MNPVLFSIGNIEIMWYSVLILIGIIIGLFLVIKEGEKFGYDKDFLFNLIFWTIIFAFLGARIYYVIFNFSLYQNDPFAIFKIWEGGLAIHGGLIFGAIMIFIYGKKHKVNVIRILDIIAPAIILAQSIGRWGNFFNSEAHGPVTSLATLQNLNIPEFIIDGMFINGNYYHPTFLYESIWCLIGFIVLLIIRKFKYVKCGQMISIYLIWYGIGRFFIESMRTDSLMAGGFKAAQIVSIIMILGGIIYTIYINRKSKFENLYNANEQGAKF